MALVLFCGFPASGKSTVADALANLLASNGSQVHIIRDGSDSSTTETLEERDAFQPSQDNNSRQALYKSSGTEKKTRARVRAATERALNPSNVVICDSLNYIKGFRYEMYCTAKTSSMRYCVVHCESKLEECLQRDANRATRGEDSYGEGLVRAIIQRFEEPRETNRWDSPLYKVDISKEDWKMQLETIRDAVLNKAQSLAPTMATKQPQKHGADTLGLLDRITRETEAMLIREIHAGKGIGDHIKVSGASKSVRLERKPKIAQLRNMRRSYLNLARMHPPQGGSTQDLLDEYIEYVNAQLRTA
ncbi:protein KTI12 [Gracilaria domingensis]|nr:protein KTI12 [Gracilaria domingensis]